MGTVPKAFIFDQIKTIFSDYQVELLKKDNWDASEAKCPMCENKLLKLDNIIIITDKKDCCYGLNCYYCSKCHILFIDEKELLIIRDHMSGNSAKVAVLSNYERNLKNNEKIPPTREAILRDLLDVINVKNNSKYKIAKAESLPKQCPVCDRVFPYYRNVLTVRREDDSKDFVLRGCCCRKCGLVYVEEESLFGLHIAGMAKDSIVEAEVNDLSEEEKQAIERLPNELADGKILYIHRGKIICDSNGHDVISVTAEVPVGSTGETVEININYCLTCDRCFINNTVYEWYRNNGLLPAIRLARVKQDGTYPSEYETELAEESPLHLLGYNVSRQDDYSDEYRQHLLGEIMDCGVLSKHQIENYLSLFIQTNSSRENMKLAVSKWKKDLEFVEFYRINRQARVVIKTIKPYNG